MLLQSDLRQTEKTVPKGYLYARSYPVNKSISVVIPTIGEIIEDEPAYYNTITTITATPADFMVRLDDIGIDFSTITSFELFLMMFNEIKKMDTSLIFGDLDLTKFEMAVNQQNNDMVLIDKENDIVIDKAIHDQICRIIRKINHLEKNDRKPANEEAKKYMIERARAKQRRAARKPYKSQLEDLIIALVNTEQFKYDYMGTLDMTIYQFYASLNQIIKKIKYDNLMVGYYAGTVNAKELSQDQLNWLTSK